VSETPITLAHAREEHSLGEPAPTPDALLAFDGGKASTIRDYRYVLDIALEAQVEKA
jgi:hypothetical protein